MVSVAPKKYFINNVNFSFKDSVEQQYAAWKAMVNVDCFVPTKAALDKISLFEPWCCPS